jgi:hypothetical protein
MIWRRSVQTQLIQDWTAPNLPLFNLNGDPFDLAQARMIAFGWSMESLADQEVWKRLAAGDFGPSGWHRSLVLSSWDDNLRSEAEEAVPPSERGSFLLWLDKDGRLAEELQPDQEGSCGAWHPPGRLLALGMATEKAWEAMAASLGDSSSAG